MSQYIKNVMVAGAGGNLGTHLIKALTNEPSFTVSILSRPDSQSTFPEGIKVIKSDYTPASLVSAFKGQDAIIAAVASHAIGSQTTMIDAAIEAGVKRFIPGEFGSDTTNANALRRVPVLQGKATIAEYCRKNQDKISWTGMITGPFFDWGMRVAFLGVDLSKQTATLYDEAHAQRFSNSTLEDIGLAVARSLLPDNYAKTANRYVYIRSLTTTQDEILAASEKVTGKKFETKNVRLTPLVEDANEKAKKGDFSGMTIPFMLLGALWDPTCGGDFDERNSLDNDLLGLPKRTVEECVKDLL